VSKVYVASSWRNIYQPSVVEQLRAAGHEVYDFRNPDVDYNNLVPGNHGYGFHWSDIDPEWKTWHPHTYREALKHPVAVSGFESDYAAMQWADTCVLVLPCGRSAHAEAGWMAGQGKRVFVYICEPIEPELMYLMFNDIYVTMSELLDRMIAVGNDARRIAER
jgi:hypothetical protein